MSADDVVFMDPPAVGRGTGGGDPDHWATKRRAVLATLRENPGQWARVASGLKQGTAAKRAMSMNGRGKGAWREVTPGDVEATSRRNDEGTYDVFARFIGGES